MSGGGCNASGARIPLKIVVINTQYVEADETSFKSVVQELTGKDSGVVGNNTHNTIAPTKSRKIRPYSGTMLDEGITHPSASAAAGINEMGRSNLFSPKDLSFNDFDRLLKEMPPVDEIYNGLWG